MKQKLHEMLLDWFNNFLTVECFAEYYDISVYKAIHVIQLGRKIHNKEVKL